MKIFINTQTDNLLSFYFKYRPSIEAQFSPTLPEVLVRRELREQQYVDELKFCRTYPTRYEKLALDETIQSFPEFRQALKNQNLPVLETELSQLRMGIEGEIRQLAINITRGNHILPSLEEEISLDDGKLLNYLLRKTGSNLRFFLAGDSIIFGEISKEKIGARQASSFFFSKIQVNSFPELGCLNEDFESALLAKPHWEKLHSEAWLVVNSQGSATKNDRIEHLKKLLPFLLHLYQIHKISEIFTSKGTSLVEDCMRCVSWHETGHIRIRKRLGRKFIPFSYIINQGRNPLMEIEEILADINIFNHIFKSRRKDKATIKLLLLWQWQRNSLSESDLCHFQYIFSLISFISRRYLDLEKVRITDKAEIVRLLHNLSEYFYRILEQKFKEIKKLIPNYYTGERTFEAEKIFVLAELEKAGARPHEIESNLWQNLFENARPDSSNIDTDLLEKLFPDRDHFIKKVFNFPDFL